MTEKPGRYDRGRHPNSLVSLTGREQFYDEPKKGRQISLTPTAWQKLKDMAEENKISVSELVERFAKGMLC